MKQMLSFMSLYSGCGGFDLGFKQAGFQCLGAFDIAPEVLHVHEQNLGSVVHVCDLGNRSIPIPATPRKLDVLLAGSPCQGFSTAGKRRVDDPRNELLVASGFIARKLKPTVFIAENVPGVIAGKHRNYWEMLHAILRKSGYQTAEMRLTGTEVGIAQTRRRMFLIAWRNGRDVSFSIPNVCGGVLKDALQNLDGTHNHIIRKLSRRSKHYLVARKIKPGQKLCNVRSGLSAIHTWHIPEVFGATTVREQVVLEEMLRIRRQDRVREYGDADPIAAAKLLRRFGSSIIRSLEQKGFIRRLNGHYDLAHTFNGKYRRLSWDQPSYTVDTRFGDPRYFLHPDEHRGFTVREAARIQGFPDSFVFSGTEIEQYRMVGNAVPPPMAKHLATFLKQALFN